MDIQRELGTITQQLRTMTQDIHELKSDVKGLVAFKWKIFGAATASGAICGFVSTVILEWLRR